MPHSENIDAPFLDEVVFTSEYQSRAALFALIFTISTYVFFYVLSNVPVKFLALSEAAKKKGQKRETFLREAAGAVVSFLYHGVAGPYSAYMTYRLLRTVPSFSSPQLIMRDDASPRGSEINLLMNDLMYLSEIFVGYMISLVYFWIIRWETGVVQLIHHLTFLLVSILSANYFFLVGIVSLSMEISSPFLNVHLIFRNIAGPTAESISTSSTKIFAVLFFIFRIIGYGCATAVGTYIFMTQVSTLIFSHKVHCL